MDEAEALELLADHDDIQARRAFTWLFERERPALVRSLRPWLGPHDSAGCEDVIQQTALNLWSARSRFSNLGMPAWRVLARRTAIRIAIDTMRARKHCAEAADEGDLELADHDLDEAARLVDQLDLQAALERISHHADTLWLGLDRDTTPECRTRQLLAAQLYYLDGHAPERILRLLGGSPGSQRLTQERLDHWLLDPGVLRQLAFQVLYYSNDRLTATILQLPRTPEPREWTELACQAARRRPGEEAFNHWTWGEVLILIWRYRLSMLPEQIGSRADCPYSGEEIGQIIARSRACFPFAKKAVWMLDRLAVLALSVIHQVFVKPGLWQRLAFEYRYLDDLPIRDVCERIDEPARLAGYRVSEDSVTAWLSGRRLLGRLITECFSAGTVSDA